MKWLKLFENFNKIENIAIIGGGMASLYCAYLLKNHHPEIKYTIYESEEELGGRVKMFDFAGVKVPTGAQFTRLQKDKTLGKLLKELDIKLDKYKMKMEYTFKEYSFDEYLKKLKSESKNFSRHKINFAEFAKEVLKDDYDNFINMLGYTDYLEYDFIDALDNYGLEDNVPGYEAANVPWDKVILALEKSVGKKNIKLGTKITSIKKTSDKFILNSKFEHDAVVLGVTVGSLRKLLGNKTCSGIESQNFIKIFAKTDDIKLDHYTIIDSPLRKVLPVKSGVYTVAFSDNKDATKLKSATKDYIQKELSREFEHNVELQDMKKFYWKEGTHYFKPLPEKYSSREKFIKDAQHPEENMWIIGEVVAIKQGWVNGALESVHNISLFKNI